MACFCHPSYRTLLDDLLTFWILSASATMSLITLPAAVCVPVTPSSHPTLSFLRTSSALFAMQCLAQGLACSQLMLNKYLQDGKGRNRLAGRRLGMALVGKKECSSSLSVSSGEGGSTGEVLATVDTDQVAHPLLGTSGAGRHSTTGWKLTPPQGSREPGERLAGVPESGLGQL